MDQHSHIAAARADLSEAEGLINCGSLGRAEALRIVGDYDSIPLL